MVGADRVSFYYTSLYHAQLRAAGWRRIAVGKLLLENLGQFSASKDSYWIDLVCAVYGDLRRPASSNHTTSVSGGCCEEGC